MKVWQKELQLRLPWCFRQFLNFRRNSKFAFYKNWIFKIWIIQNFRQLSGLSVYGGISNHILRHNSQLLVHLWKRAISNGVIKISPAGVSVSELFVCLCAAAATSSAVWSDAARRCSDATFSSKLWAAATVGSVTCAAAVETESSHQLIKTLDTGESPHRGPSPLRRQASLF